MSLEVERRLHRRVTLQPPLVGSVGRAAVIVLDASRGGFRVAHRSALPEPGDRCRVEVHTGRSTVVFECVVVRTLEQPNPLAETNGLYQSGLQIVAADERARKRLETLL